MTNPEMTSTSEYKPLSIGEKIDLIIKQQNLLVTILGEVKFYGVNERQQKLLKTQFKKLQKQNWALLEDRRKMNESKKESNAESGTKEKS